LQKWDENKKLKLAPSQQNHECGANFVDSKMFERINRIECRHHARTVHYAEVTALVWQRVMFATRPLWRTNNLQIQTNCISTSKHLINMFDWPWKELRRSKGNSNVITTRSTPASLDPWLSRVCLNLEQYCGVLHKWSEIQHSIVTLCMSLCNELRLFHLPGTTCSIEIFENALPSDKIIPGRSFKNI
jgi:hypothetical protein